MRGLGEQHKSKKKKVNHKVSKLSKEQLINRAIKFHLEGNIQEASKYYQYCLDQGLNDQRIFSNYGVILKNLGKLKEAEIFYRKAIKLNPNYVDAHSNLGLILNDLEKFEEAEISYRKAIELNPNHANAHYNLGNILKYIGKLKEAEIYYRKAIELNPNFGDAYLNLGFIELLKGNYKSGLEYYEFRMKTKYNQPSIPHAQPKIDRIDQERLNKGEKILVLSEQGLGDTLQYMRYIPYLRNEGFDISFCAQNKLHSLIKASGIDQNPLAPGQANSVLEGKWISLLSLPKYLKINPSNPIISKPYIFSTFELKKKWNNILSKEKRPIVGINWQGNPRMEKTYKGRSIPLEIFSILLAQNDITMLSLQKGFGSEQLDDCSFKNQFVQSQSRIDSTWDFLENAAIIENCDLIITCDTSIAHLAGGMGKKVWLLLRDIPYWTWGLKEESTFWYPSMRLFRQKERHNWNEVMERVSNALLSFEVI